MFYVIFGWKVKQYCLATKSHQKSQISADGICTFFFWNFTPRGFGRLSSMIIKMQPQRKLDWTRHKAYKQDGFCKGYRTVRWLNMHNLLSFHLKSIPIGGNMRFLVTFFWRSNTPSLFNQISQKTYHLKAKRLNFTTVLMIKAVHYWLLRCEADRNTRTLILWEKGGLGWSTRAV